MAPVMMDGAGTPVDIDRNVKPAFGRPTDIFEPSGRVGQDVARNT